MVTFSNSSVYKGSFSFLRDFLKSNYPELDAHVTVRDLNRVEECGIILTTRAADSVHASVARSHADSAIRVLRGTYRKARFENAC